jgi:hypothetical protein
MKIVMVQLGEELPKILVENIIYLKTVFPQIKIVLIESHKLPIPAYIQSQINVFQMSSNELLMLQNDIYSVKKPDLKFRKGYWFFTLARLYALNEFAKVNDGPFLHVESDVMLLPNFPFESFQAIKEISYPLVDSEYGIASTVYIPDSAKLSLFWEFARSKLSENPILSDMELLGLYQSRYPSRVFVQPSIPPIQDFYSSDTSIERKNLLSSNFEFFGGIFDGMNWGMFLTGEDPRNRFGLRRLFHHQCSLPLNLTSAKFKVVDNQLFCYQGNCLPFPVYSIHLHSKDIRYFHSQDLLEKRTVQNQDRIQRSEVVPRVMISMLPKFITFSLIATLRVMKRWLKSVCKFCA